MYLHARTHACIHAHTHTHVFSSRWTYCTESNRRIYTLGRKIPDRCHITTTRITLQRVGYSEQHSQIISGSRFSRAETNNGKMFFVVFRLRGKEKLVKLEYNEFGSVNRCCCWRCCRRGVCSFFCAAFRFNTISRSFSFTFIMLWNFPIEPQ